MVVTASARVQPVTPGAVPPEPSWEVAHLFPARGEWSEADYLAMPTSRMVELSEGCLDVLPLPTEAHQFILRFLQRALEMFVGERSLGVVLFAGVPVRLWPGKMRQPDSRSTPTGGKGLSGKARTW